MRHKRADKYSVQYSMLRSTWTTDSLSLFVLGVAAGLVLATLTPRRKEYSISNATAAPRRFGAVIRLRPEKYETYRQLHDSVWQQVLDRMTASNIRNFTIYYHKETSTLFQHFEWIGHWKMHPNQDERALFEHDMAAIASDPVTQKWWSECEPCQEPFSQWPTAAAPPSKANGSPEGDWWAPLECVAYCGHWPLVFSDQQQDPDFVKRKVE